MKFTVLVALRNDEGQFLVLENKGGFCSIPGCPRELTQSPFVVSVQYMRSLGLEVGGLTPLRGSFELAGCLVQGMSAYLISGKVKPSADTRSVSWISPTVALKMKELTDASKIFLEPSLWVGGVTPK